MEPLKNLTVAAIAALQSYVIAFVMIVISGANELSSKGSPMWFNILTYAAIGISGLLTLWTLVLLVQKIRTRIRG